MTSSKWTAADIPPQDGKTAIVTGANSGLGYWNTLELARKGAYVVMACRDTAKGEAARDEILAQASGASIEVEPLDLSDLSSVEAFAAAYRQKQTQLHMLYNNAGVMNIPRVETVDGFEMQFATNHLGHFALTGHLVDLLTGTPESRVVTVSSSMHHRGSIDLDDLMGEAAYDPWGAYSQSKLANLLFAYELQRKFEEAGESTISVGAHPGYSATNLQQAGPSMSGARGQMIMMRILNRLVAQSAAIGALPQLYAGTAPGVKGGTFYGPSGFQEMRGYPVQVESSASSYDQSMAERLWSVSEQLTGVKF